MFYLFSLLSSLFFFLWILSVRAGPPLSPFFHPHSWLSDCRSVHGGRSQFSRCCYLTIDLGSRPSTKAGPGVRRRHLISAVELGCSNPPMRRSYSAMRSFNDSISPNSGSKTSPNSGLGPLAISSRWRPAFSSHLLSRVTGQLPYQNSICPYEH